MRPPPSLAALTRPVSRPLVQGATVDVEKTTITTPESSAAGPRFSWPKSYNLLRLFGILALICLGAAFAHFSYSATSALLSSQRHDSQISDSNAVESPYLFSVSSGCADWQRACADWQRACASFACANSSLLEDGQGELKRAEQALGDPHCTPHAAASAATPSPLWLCPPAAAARSACPVCPASTLAPLAAPGAHPPPRHGGTAIFARVRGATRLLGRLWQGPGVAAHPGPVVRD